MGETVTAAGALVRVAIGACVIAAIGGATIGDETTGARVDPPGAHPQIA
jgi:hypothetical protein